ncbi:hypothetical protein JCM8547_001106 [Rhodosporidiobolus lusitaniae]
MVSCQRCRQPLALSSFPPLPPHSSSSLDDSVAALSPSTYDLLSASDRLPHPPAPASPAGRIHAPAPSSSSSSRNVLHSVASRQPHSAHAQPPHRIVVPSPHPHQSGAGAPRSLNPTDSFVVLSDSVYRPTPHSSHFPTPPVPSSSSPPSPADSPSTSFTAQQAALLTPRLSTLSHLTSLLSSTSSVDHPLCTECTEVLLGLMSRELEEGKKERDRLVGFEREVMKKRQENPGVTREGLEKEVHKYKTHEATAIADLKAVEARKRALEEEAKELEKEEEELEKEEAEFWRLHSLYLLQRDALLDREAALTQKLARAASELDKLGRTNVYNDSFCIGQEAGFGTINSLRLGRLPSSHPPVDWPEINAAWGLTLLLLHTVATKFGFPDFVGYRLVPCGSFSSIEKRGTDEKGRGTCEVLELYGSSDLSVTRLLQNRRFDQAMVAFLECLRQLGEWVMKRDPSVRLPHAVVKDKIGDVSIKLQFGSDEAWTRALRHVLLDLKILLSRASA